MKSKIERRNYWENLDRRYKFKAYNRRPIYYRQCKKVNGIDNIMDLDKKLGQLCIHPDQDLLDYMDEFIDQVPITLWADKYIMKTMVFSINYDADFLLYFQNHIQNNYNQFSSINELYLYNCISDIYRDKYSPWLRTVRAHFQKFNKKCGIKNLFKSL